MWRVSAWCYSVKMSWGNMYSQKELLCWFFLVFYLSYIDWQKNYATPLSTPFHWIGELNLAQCRPSIPSHLDCPNHLPNTRRCTVGECWNTWGKPPRQGYKCHQKSSFVIFIQWYLVEFLFFLSSCPAHTHTHTKLPAGIKDKVVEGQVDLFAVCQSYRTYFKICIKMKLKNILLWKNQELNVVCC